MLGSHSASARVHRRGLINRFDVDVDAGVNIIVLSAPAGAGKSTTLEQWATRRRSAGDIVVRVNLAGSATNELWPDLTTAVRAASTEDPDTSLAWSRTEFAGATQFVRTAAVGPLPASDEPARPLWIVLDDAHRLASPPALAQLGAVISAAGPRLRVALGARYTPHSSIPKLILDGVASEYRGSDLAFNRYESQSLLLTEDVLLDDADLDLLLERTEGWAAGLRLAALALARAEDRTSFVASFAGDDRAVADYLVSEVLARLPANVVELLLDVSVAETLDVDLARLLSGRPNAGAILQSLDAANALVDRAGADARSYRLHPLLRSYLQAESRRRNADRHTHRHAVAAAWYERAGDARHAIEHAIAAGEWPSVEALVTTFGPKLLAAGGPGALRTTWDLLPPDVQLRPSVAAIAALTAALDSNLPAAELDLANAEGAADVGTAERRLVVRSLMTLRETRLRVVPLEDVEAAAAALDDIARADPELYLLARAERASARLLIGDIGGAGEEAAAAAQAARRHSYDHVLLNCLNTLCAVAALRCDFAAMETAAAETVAVAQSRGWERVAQLAHPHSALAFAAWQRGDDAHAAAHASAAIAVVDPMVEPLPAAVARCIYDVTVVSPTGALDLPVIAHLREYADLWPMLPPSAVALGACYQVTICVRGGELGWARSVVERLSMLAPDYADAAVMRAMLHMYSGRHTSARREIAPVLAADRPCAAPTSSIVAWAIAAHLADHAGEQVRAHEAMMHALELAEPCRVVRLLVDAAPSVAQILTRNRGRFGRFEPFVEDVLTVAARITGPVTDHSGVVLTDRERALLLDLPSLLSMQEIAAAHVISINTVKTHLKAVYRKLGVATRREAVDHARELGLL